MTARSYLFIPGDSDKKLGKAADTGADALILDLEDSVAPARKRVAREMVLAYLQVAGVRRSELWVRMNPISEGGIDDLVAIVRGAPDGIMVPKVDGPEDLIRVGHCLDALERRDGVTHPIRLLPVVTETARAPFALGRYAEVPIPRLHGLTWGAEDLSAAIGASTNRDLSGGWALTYRVVRSHCLLAAKACGVEAIETLYSDFRDEAGLRADCAEASREGFTGRIAIHPAQVAAINEAFSPSADEITHADRVVAAFAQSPGIGVVGLNGKMLDIPHLKQAEKVLARAAALARRTGA